MARQVTLLDGDTGQKLSSLEVLAGAVATGALPVGTRDFAPLVWDVATQSWVQGTIIDVSIIQGFNGGVGDLNLNSDATINISGLVNHIGPNGGGQGAVSAGRVAGNPQVGFFDAPRVGQPTVTGSRGGNAALADLLTQLATLGLIIDGTSA